MFQNLSFDDGRGAYSDVIRARAPRGLRQQINQAAKQEGISAGEFIRRAVTRHMQSVMNGDDGCSRSEARA